MRDINDIDNSIVETVEHVLNEQETGIFAVFEVHDDCLTCPCPDCCKMKYFDDKGNFKAEIKTSAEICSQEDVDEDGRYESAGNLLPNVRGEVYENWKRFPAESDIVATYWVSAAAGSTHGNYNEDTLLHRVIFSSRKNTK